MEDIYFELYQKSNSNYTFRNISKYIFSEQNIILAYRNILKNPFNNISGADGVSIRSMNNMSLDFIIKKIQNKVKYYKPKKTVKKEYNNQQIYISSLWDRLICQCIFQVLDPICEAKFHDRSNAFRPYRAPQNAIAQCYKMAQLQKLQYVINIDIDNIFKQLEPSILIRQLWAMGIQDKKLLSLLKAAIKSGISCKNMLYESFTQNQYSDNLSCLLINVYLNKMDWWIAKQWETFKIKEGSTGYEFVKVDSLGNKTIDYSQKWKKLRETTNLKEIYLVRYGCSVKIFCRNYNDAKRTLIATKLWLLSNLNIEDINASITDLNRGFSNFLGVKFKLQQKGNKFVITSCLSDFVKDNIVVKLRQSWKRITNPSNQKYIDKNISLFNSSVIGLHKYFSMATMVSKDFSEIAYLVYGKSNGLNKNSRCINISKLGEINNSFISKTYGNSKQLRWISSRVIVPIAYVQHKYPKYKRRGVNKYIKNSGFKHGSECVSFEVVKHLIENAYNYPTPEMADNAISKYISQKGLCAITKVPLQIGDMECHHIKPVRFSRNDSFDNLMMITRNSHKIITVTNKATIQKYINILNPNPEVQKRINKLRILQGLDEIQFDDYINTKN